MRYLRNLLFLTIAIFGLTLTSVNAQNFSGGNQPSLKTIERKVFKEILKLPYYGVFDNIKFQVSGNNVTLLGKVTQPTTRKSAERVVKRIAGVENVINNIEVLPLSNYDDSIRLETLRALRNGGGLYRYFSGVNPSMRIIVDRGRITLEGYVANRGDYNLANILANGVFGSFGVQNNLIVEKELIR